VSQANGFDELSSKEQLAFYDKVKTSQEGTSLQAYEDLFDKVRTANAVKVGKQEQVRLEIEKERKQQEM